VNLEALLTAFGLIFVAELPDKTAYTVLLLAARGRPLAVLLGAWCAFAAQGLIAVALGTLLAQLPPTALRWFAGAVFVFFGLLLLLREEKEEAQERALTQRREFFTALGLVFLAEMGDATQIASAALVARLHARWSVFAGATLALWSVAGLAVTVGSTLGPRVPRRALRKAAGAVFIVFGVASALFA
jgi:putative Ca2+/H+ antiporter (TMEM165/GDT1 family)